MLIRFSTVSFNVGGCDLSVGQPPFECTTRHIQHIRHITFVKRISVSHVNMYDPRLFTYELRMREEGVFLVGGLVGGVFRIGLPDVAGPVQNGIVYSVQ